MNFLLKVMRLLHMIIGITPARPEQERTFLLLWLISIIAIGLIGIAVAVFLAPRIIQ